MSAIALTPKSCGLEDPPESVHLPSTSSFWKDTDSCTVCPPRETFVNVPAPQPTTFNRPQLQGEAMAMRCTVPSAARDSAFASRFAPRQAPLVPILRHSRPNVPGAVADCWLQAPELGSDASQLTYVAKLPVETPGSWIGAKEALVPGVAPESYVNVTGTPSFQGNEIQVVGLEHQPLQTTAIGATALSFAGA